MKSVNNITYDTKVLAHFCLRHHIQKFSFFGSILRDDFNEESDIDVLVEFEEGNIPGFFTIFDMEIELTYILGCKKADIRTVLDLSRYFRDDVLSNMRVLYEAK